MPKNQKINSILFDNDGKYDDKKFSSIMMQMYQENHQKQGNQASLKVPSKSNLYSFPKYDYGNIKQQLEAGQKSRMQEKSLQKSDGQPRQQGWNLEAEKGDQMIPGLLGQIGAKKITEGQQPMNSSKKSFYDPEQLIKAGLKGLAPFLKASENPYDRHANSKLMKQKFDHVSYNDRMRNIAALVENSKRGYDSNINIGSALGVQARRAYSQVKHTTGKLYGSQVSFQPKSHIYPQTQNFQQTSKSGINKNFGMALNVSDVLKYTLGAKRQKDRNIQPQPIRNPFVRVPVKFSQSLNGFYKPN